MRDTITIMNSSGERKTSGKVLVRVFTSVKVCSPANSVMLKHKMEVCGATAPHRHLYHHSSNRFMSVTLFFRF